LWHLL